MLKIKIILKLIILLIESNASMLIFINGNPYIVNLSLS